MPRIRNWQDYKFFRPSQDAVYEYIDPFGKSTIVRNLGYEMSKLGSKVALIDLDPQHNLDLFCGFPLAEQMDNTIVRVLSEKFDGLWSLSTIPTESIEVCRGHIGMAEIQNELVNRRRSECVLADRLHKSLLPHDVILIDCQTGFDFAQPSEVERSRNLNPQISGMLFPRKFLSCRPC